ncbi:MAG: redoxin domain-containing protein [Phycisphaerales bacterium]|nr:redoxin domain-containing protein [Phycisphaerales bacterium]
MTTAAPALSVRDSIIPVGAAAPMFELPTTVRGETWKLADAIKKGDVVLSFFPMAFTGVCSMEMECITKEFAKLQAKGGGHSTAVGISCDSGPALGAWATQLGLTHTLLSDMHRTVCKAYGLYWPDMNIAWRGTVIVGTDGKVKWSQKRDIPAAFKLDEVLDALS